MSGDPKNALKQSYDRVAESRAGRSTPVWEQAPRDGFIGRIVSEGAHSVLELGAGTGADAREFESKGLRVVCTDLSETMIELCRANGLDAHVMDVSDLSFFSDASFDAVYANNCLVHVPKNGWRSTLAAMRRVLRRGGLCYLAVAEAFHVESFERIMEGWRGLHYQVLLLRRAR